MRFLALLLFFYSDLSFAVCSISYKSGGQVVSSTSISPGDIYDKASSQSIKIYETCDSNYKIKITSTHGALINNISPSIRDSYSVQLTSSAGNSLDVSSEAITNGMSLELSRNLSSMRTILGWGSTQFPENYESNIIISVPRKKRAVGNYTDDLIVNIEPTTQ